MSGFLGAIASILVAPLVVAALVGAASLRNLSPPPTPPYARRAPTGSGSAIHHDQNATFLRDRGFMFVRRLWFAANCCPPQRIDQRFYDYVMTRHWQEPVKLLGYGHRTWWMFEGQIYWEAAGYTAQDVMALIRDRARKQQNRLDRAHLAMRLEQQPRPRRTALTKTLKRAVFERDGGECVECGSTFDLQYDHIIPFSMGGATSLENLQLLCSTCNQAKGGRL